MAKGGPKLTAFKWNVDAPRLVQAASLALGILSFVKCRTVADLDLAMRSDDPVTRALVGNVVLGDDARALLSDPVLAPMLGLLRAKTKQDKREVALSVAVCPDCGQWTLAGSGAIGKCTLTRGCAGKPVKAVKATMTDVEDAVVAPDDPGLFGVRGPGVPSEYDLPGDTEWFSGQVEPDWPDEGCDPYG